MWSPATMTIKKTKNMERYGFPVTITHIDAFLKREPIKRTTPSMTITIYTTGLQLQSAAFRCILVPADLNQVNGSLPGLCQT